MSDLRSGSDDPFALERRTVNGFDVLVYSTPAIADLRDLLLRSVDHPPDHPYLIHDNRTLTYGELVPAVGTLASVLVDECGLTADDRVAVYAANSIEWTLTAWAAVATGRIVVGGNAWWHASEAIAALTATTPRVLVVDQRRLDGLAERLDELPFVEHILVIDGDGAAGDGDLGDPRCRPFPDRTAESGPLPEADIDPDQPATILFTSGTTGNAKGVIGTHRAATSTLQNLMWAGLNYFPSVALAPLPSEPPGPPCTVLAAPMFHVAGLQWGIMFPVATGGTVVLHTGRYDPATVMAMVERHRCDSLGGVPTMMTRIVDHPDRHSFDLSSVRSVSWGGAPPPPTLVEDCLETFPNLLFIGTGYGLTETCGLLIYATGTDYVGRPGTAGKVFPTAELRICGPGDTPVPAGEEGEVQLRGPMVMPGYWGDPEASSSALTDDGWLRSGDLGIVDADGFLTLTGRSKELIIRGGENVHPVEIEDVLSTHESVLDAAVVGRPHADLGEEVIAVVQVVDPESVTAADLQRHVASHLAAFKVPVDITVQADPLPRNAAGKLLRDTIAGGRLRLTETL